MPFAERLSPVKVFDPPAIARAAEQIGSPFAVVLEWLTEEVELRKARASADAAHTCLPRPRHKVHRARRIGQLVLMICGPRHVAVEAR